MAPRTRMSSAAPAEGQQSIQTDSSPSKSGSKQLSVKGMLGATKPRPKDLKGLLGQQASKKDALEDMSKEDLIKKIQMMEAAARASRTPPRGAEAAGASPPSGEKGKRSRSQPLPFIATKKSRQEEGSPTSSTPVGERSPCTGEDKASPTQKVHTSEELRGGDAEGEAEAAAIAEGDADEEEEEVQQELEWDVRVANATSVWTADAIEEHLKGLEADASKDGHLKDFAQVASALERPGPAGPLRGLARLLGRLLRSGAGASDLGAVLNILACHTKPFAVPQPQIVAAISAAFGLKEQGIRAAASMDDIASHALAVRQRQRVLFQPKPVALSEVVALLAELEAASGEKPSAHAPQRMTQLLGRSVAEGRETWHLVRLLQGRPAVAAQLVLQATAHMCVLEVDASANDLAKRMVSMEDAVMQAWAEGGTTALAKWLTEGGTTPNALGEAAGVCSGTRVLPMQAEAPTDIAKALERLGGGAAVRAEWQLEGERAQVHVLDGGASVQVFTVRGQACPERAEAASAALRGNLNGVQDCILEVILMKPYRPPAKKRASGASEGTSSGEQTTTSGTESAEGPWSTMTSLAPFDILALNGRPLTQLSFRERRAQLEKCVSEAPCLRLPRGTELADSGLTVAAVREELDKALTAYFLADPADKVSSRAFGLVLRLLDGPGARYFAGRRSPAWQAVHKPPAATGAKADALLLEHLSEEEKAVIPDASEFHFSVVSARRTQTEEGVKDILAVQSQFKACGVSPRWYVDAPSLESYKALGLEAVVGGKLIPARNLALDDAAAMGKACVQISDDISRWEFYKGDEQRAGTFELANAAAKRADRWHVSPVAAARFLLAKMRGTRDGPQPQLGGVYPLGNTGQAFNANSYSLQNFVLGDFFVVDKSPCRFDLRMSLKEDYDLTCSHLKEHGAVLRCNRLIIRAKHETNSGGACSVRDAQGERERENIRILQTKWPGVFTPHPTRPNQVVLRWRGYKPDQATA